MNENIIRTISYVNKFINSKRLERCSELTIKNYKIHIYKMLSYLDKDVRTIETDGIREFLSYYQSNNSCNNLLLIEQENHYQASLLFLK